MKHFFVAGFDFGTSYSKVVIQDQNTRIQKVVTFGDDVGALFPSCVYVGEDWISGPDGMYEGILVTYPKLVAADAASGSSVFQSVTSGSCREAQELLGIEDPKQFAKLILTRYLLSVLNGIHDFISGDDDWHSFDPYSDPFVVQLAVPTGLMDKADRKTEIFMRECLMAATRVRDALSATESWSSIHDLTDALAGVGSLSTEERRALEERCITYPEVAAGVQPILQSRSVRDGKYITLDVGAGTVDLNAFHRWTRDTDHKSLDYWACQVAPLGFARLALSGNRRGRSEHEVTVNPLSEDELIQKLRSSIQALVHKAFKYQPYKSAGDGPSPWMGETYAYIWGGGAQHPAFENCFLKVLQEFNIGINGINRLPRPNNDLHLPPGVDFGRLAIAFGLSYYHPNLREIRLPSNLKSYAEQYGIAAVDPPRHVRNFDS